MSVLANTHKEAQIILILLLLVFDTIPQDYHDDHHHDQIHMTFGQQVLQAETPSSR